MKDMTLVERLDLIKTIPTSSPGELRKGIIEGFFKENPLADEVAKASTSYRAAILPIVERYDSFFKRITHPKPDENFDNLVRGTIKSLNAVGIGYSNPEVFTFEGRRTRMQGYEALLTGGAALVNLLGFFTVGKKIPTWMKGASLGLLAAGYSTAKVMHNIQMLYCLEELQQTAEAAQGYLREM